jgi:hypothetical protein
VPFGEPISRGDYRPISKPGSVLAEYRLKVLL